MILLPYEQPWDEQPYEAAQCRADLFGSRGVLYSGAEGPLQLDRYSLSLGAISGDVSSLPGWIATSPGNYITGGSRSNFSGAAITVFYELVLGSAPTSGTSHVLGTVGDQFIQASVGYGTTNLALNHSIYIAGALRIANQALKGSAAVVGDVVFGGFTFAQPAMVAFAAWNGGPLAYTSAVSFGASIADSGGSLLIGRNSAGSSAFTGGVRKFGIVGATLWRAQIEEIYRAWRLALFEEDGVMLPIASGGAAAPSIILSPDGSFLYKPTPAGGDNKLYLTTAGAIAAKTAPGAGDRRISLSGGNWLAS